MASDRHSEERLFRLPFLLFPDIVLPMHPLSYADKSLFSSLMETRYHKQIHLLMENHLHRERERIILLRHHTRMQEIWVQILGLLQIFSVILSKLPVWCTENSVKVISYHFKWKGFPGLAWRLISTVGKCVIRQSQSAKSYPRARCGEPYLPAIESSLLSFSLCLVLVC